MKNTGPRFGGAITAALFLQKFVQKERTKGFQGLRYIMRGCGISAKPGILQAETLLAAAMNVML